MSLAITRLLRIVSLLFPSLTTISGRMYTKRLGSQSWTVGECEGIPEAEDLDFTSTNIEPVLTSLTTYTP